MGTLKRGEVGAILITNLFDINLNQLTNGAHRLTIRARDANNRWSIVGIRDFVIQDNFTLVGTLPSTGWCRNTTLSVPFSTVGTYNAGNIFTAVIVSICRELLMPNQVVFLRRR